jgi:hypothetical protein
MIPVTTIPPFQTRLAPTPPLGEAHTYVSDYVHWGDHRITRVG